MGSPAGAGGSGATGSTASVYTPTGQPQADQLYQQIISGVLSPVATNPAGSPGGMAYGIAQPGAQTQYDQITGAALPLGGDASRILTTAFDPQNALYQQLLNQTQQQSAAANAGAGLLGTPYGGSVADNATNQFNINWQNNQLNRQATGLGAAAGADTAGAGLFTTGLNNLSSLANLGNNQYLIPQQTLNDLQSYLGLGQSASQISGQLGALGQQELSSSLAGIGGLVGGAGSLLGGSSGIGGLLGLGGAASGGATAGLDAGAAAAGGASGFGDLLAAAPAAAAS